MIGRDEVHRGVSLKRFILGAEGLMPDITASATRQARC